MNRRNFIISVISCLVMLYSNSCKKNEPLDPEAPLPQLNVTITGPTEGYINLEYSFDFSPKKAGIHYTIDWGDGTTSDWIMGDYWIPPIKHTWTKTGHFSIRIKREGTTWCNPYYVTIKNKTMFFTNIDITNGYGKGIIQLPDTSYLVFGNLTEGSNQDEVDIFLVKVDNKGNVLWEKYFGQPEKKEWFNHYLVNSLNEITIWGYYSDFILKINANGEELFYGLTDIYSLFNISPAITDVIQTHDGNFLVSGLDLGYYYLLKFSAQGNLLWIKNLGKEKEIQQIFEEENGDILAVVQNNYNASLYITKYNADGEEKWTKLLLEGNPSFFLYYNCLEIFKIDNMHYVLCGKTSDDKLFFEKIDTNGNIIAEYRAQNFLHVIRSCIQTSDNAYVLGGSYPDLSGGRSILGKVTGEGVIIWVNNFYKENETISYENKPKEIVKVIETSDGGYACTGYKRRDVYSESMIPFIVKLNENGEVPLNLK